MSTVSGPWWVRVGVALLEMVVEVVAVWARAVGGRRRVAAVRVWGWR